MRVERRHRYKHGKHIRRAAVAPVADPAWLNFGDHVEVELTSEDADWPIEGALVPGRTEGWRAGGPGRQTIRLLWPNPIPIRRIRLVFEERSNARTQEFVLRASTRDGEREIVRQQFTFSPPGTTIECEEYATELDAVTRLELTIVPAIDNGGAIASLKEWRAA